MAVALLAALSALGVKATAEGLKQGDPFDPKTRVGPQVSESHMNSILGYIASTATAIGASAPTRLRTMWCRNALATRRKRIRRP